jgi:hypothetical protein
MAIEEVHMRNWRFASAIVIAMMGCQADRGAPPLGTASGRLTGIDCSQSAEFEIAGVGGAQFNTVAVDTSILPMSQVGRVLANDQIHMLRDAANAGLSVLNKHVPAFVIFDNSGNVTEVLSGGFYQCATLGDCQGYLTDVVANYRLDGTLFADRPEFHGSFQGHAYEVIGAAQFQDIPADYAIKITRWHVRPPSRWNPRAFLVEQWRNHARQEACERGTLAQAHLLWSEAEQVVAEVTIGTKIDPPPGSGEPYFVATLGALAGADVLDPIFDELPLDRVPPAVTDTYLVLTYWPGAFVPSRWPNSPSAIPGGPLPEPFCGDGSCNTTTTHVENATTCPADCAPGCGDGVCEAGETPDTCATDCPP